jgi:general secretion pathway protein L
MFLLLNKSRTNALAILDAWTGTVAATIIASLERMVSPRVVQLFENETGEFVLEAANKPENVPAHIPYRVWRRSVCSGQSGAGVAREPGRDRAAADALPVCPLELPARAADFLDGIMRAQIDRLTPWSADDAVFGRGAPSASGGEGITTVIAAAPRKLAMGYVEAVSGFHPSAIAIGTDAPEPGQ